MLILTPLAISTLVAGSTTLPADLGRAPSHLATSHASAWTSELAADPQDLESTRTCDIEPAERTVTATFEVSGGETTVADAGEARSPQAIADIKTAEDLFRVLEHADRDLRTLQARVMYKRVFAIAGEDQTRTGSIYFDSPVATGEGDADGAAGTARPRRFAVRFTSLAVGDRVEDEDQTYVFEGRWLTEIQGKHKQFIRREIVREGEGVDPLRVGGPLPLPIGQRSDAILSLYDATLAPVDEGLGEDAEKFREFLADCLQVRLTPKAEHRDGHEHREVRLWYRKTVASEEQGRSEDDARPNATRERLLPRLIRAVNQQDDVSLIQLVKVSVNQPLPEGVMDVSPPKEPGWDVRTESLAPAPPQTREVPSSGQVTPR